MSPVRLSGVALILGGILLAVHLFTHPAGELAKYASEPTWVPSHAIGAAAYLLIPLGLMGLYARQADRMGWLGLIALVLTFVGATLSAGASLFLSVVIVPFLATRGLDWLDPPSGALYVSTAFQIAVGISGAAVLIGMLLLAVATLRARVIPALGAWLVIGTVPLAVVAIALIFFIGTSQQGVIQAAVGAILGLGVAAWGWALWSEKRVPAPTLASAG